MTFLSLICSLPPWCNLWHHTLSLVLITVPEWMQIIPLVNTNKALREAFQIVSNFELGPTEQNDGSNVKESAICPVAWAFFPRSPWRNGVRAEHGIIQAICGGRPGPIGQLEGPSVFLVPMEGGLKSLFWASVPPKVHFVKGTASA